MSWKWALIFGLLLIPLLSASTTSTEAAVNCSSSCGGVIISDPFRLAGDPSNCGRSPGYELSCRNNRSASLNLHYSQEFDVESISYENLTIRLRDPGLQSNNCSALPKYSIHTSYPNYSYLKRPTFIPRDDQYFVTYVRCSRSIDDDPSYIATGPCINSSSSAHFYLLLGAAGRDLNESCTSIATAGRISDRVGNPTTYLDVWSDLLKGFELSWWTASCRGCEAAGCICSRENSYHRPTEWCYRSGSFSKSTAPLQLPFSNKSLISG